MLIAERTRKIWRKSRSDCNADRLSAEGLVEKHVAETLVGIDRISSSRRDRIGWPARTLSFWGVGWMEQSYEKENAEANDVESVASVSERSGPLINARDSVQRMFQAPSNKSRS